MRNCKDGLAFEIWHIQTAMVKGNQSDKWNMTYEEKWGGDGKGQLLRNW